MFLLSTLALLAWGVLAFGAEYAWAYAPLLVFCAVPGILGLRHRRGSLPSRALLAALGIILLLTVMQLVVPARVFSGMQTGAPGVDFGRYYALATMQPQPAPVANPPISIEPSRTMLGLAFLSAFTLLLAGCTRGISAVGASRLVRGIVALGVLVAFIGIVQRNVQAEAIYGFWLAPRPGIPFAPFLNENHFAGWMAMAMSLAIGSFARDVSGAFRKVEGWRRRILWFGTPAASRLLLTGFGIVMMALSMVITGSRGGLVALMAVGVAGAWWMVRRQSGMRRGLAGAALIAVVILAASWGGAEQTVKQFAGALGTLGDRGEIWSDSMRVVRDHPLTGTGLNTFGIAMLHYQSSPYIYGVVLEAHNDYLQLAAEGGLLVGIPIIAALAIFARDVWRRFREGRDDPETYWLRSGAVIGLCAIAVMESFDFTLQMPGAAATFVVLAAIAMHEPNHSRRAPERVEGRP